MERNPLLSRRIRILLSLGSIFCFPLSLHSSSGSTANPSREPKPAEQKKIGLDKLDILPRLKPSITEGIFAFSRYMILSDNQFSVSLTQALNNFEKYSRTRGLDLPDLQDYYLSTLNRPINYRLEEKSIQPLQNNIDPKKLSAIKEGTPILKKNKATMDPKAYLLIQLAESTKFPRKRLLNLLQKKEISYDEQYEILTTLQSVTQNLISFLEQLAIENITAKFKSPGKKNSHKATKDDVEESSDPEEDNEEIKASEEGIINKIIDLLNQQNQENSGKTDSLQFAINPLAPLILLKFLLPGQGNNKIESYLNQFEQKSSYFTQELYQKKLPRILEEIEKDFPLQDFPKTSEWINGVKSYFKKLTFTEPNKKNYEERIQANELVHISLFKTKDPLEQIEQFVELIMFLGGGQKLSRANLNNLRIIVEAIHQNLHATIENLDKILSPLVDITNAQSSDKIQTHTGIGQILKTDILLGHKKNPNITRITSNPATEKNIRNAQQLLEEIATIERTTIPDFGTNSFSHQRFANIFQQLFPPQISAFMRAIPRVGAKIINPKPTFFIPNTTQLQEELAREYGFFKSDLQSSDTLAGKSANTLLNGVEKICHTTSNQINKGRAYFSEKCAPKLQEKYGNNQVFFGAVNEGLSFTAHAAEHATSRFAPYFENNDSDAKKAEKIENLNTKLFWTMRIIPFALTVPIIYTLIQEGRKTWHSSESIKQFMKNAVTRTSYSIVTLNAIPTILRHTMTPLTVGSNRYTEKAIGLTKQGQTIQVTERFCEPRSITDQITRAKLWCFNGIFKTNNISSQTGLSRTYTYTKPSPSKWGGLLGLPLNTMPNLVGLGIGATIATTLGALYLTGGLFSAAKVANACAEGEDLWNGTRDHMISNMRHDLKQISLLSDKAASLIQIIKQLNIQELDEHREELHEIINSEPIFALKEKCHDANIFKIIETHTQVKKHIPALMYHIGMIDFHLAQQEQVLNKNTSTRLQEKETLLEKAREANQVEADQVKANQVEADQVKANQVEADQVKVQEVPAGWLAKIKKPILQKLEPVQTLVQQKIDSITAPVKESIKEKIEPIQRFIDEQKKRPVIAQAIANAPLAKKIIQDTTKYMEILKEDDSTNGNKQAPTKKELKLAQKKQRDFIEQKKEYYLGKTFIKKNMAPKTWKGWLALKIANTLESAKPWYEKIQSRR